MLDLELSEEHLAIAELARNIGLDVVSPAAREAESTRTVPAKVWTTLFQSGLTVAVPEKFGGGGIPDAVTQMIAVEGLAYGDPGITIASVWGGAAALLIGLCGSEAQTGLLSHLGRDPEARSAVALYEGFGRGPSELTTTISDNGDGTWQVTGRKVAVPFATEADPLIVVGVDPADGTLRAAILAATGGGTVIAPNDRSLALDAVPVATVSFDERVGAADLLGGPGAGAGALARGVGRLRLALAAAEVGTAQRANDYAATYATERIAFGQPIATFQGVSFLLAEAQIRIAAARLDIINAAIRIDAGDDSAEEATTRAVNYAGVVATQVTRDAVQVLGGHGFITDHPVELWYRSAATLSAIDFDPLRSSFEPAL
jgi:alkylation response protein AidB-like acyl-CoA dehydrogenase